MMDNEYLKFLRDGKERRKQSVWLKSGNVDT